MPMPPFDTRQPLCARLPFMLPIHYFRHAAFIIFAD
jgi:hypothetical protein